MEQDKHWYSSCLEVQSCLTLPVAKLPPALLKNSYPAPCLSTCRSRAVPKVHQRRNFCFLLLLRNDSVWWGAPLCFEWTGKGEGREQARGGWRLMALPLQACHVCEPVCWAVWMGARCCSGHRSLWQRDAMLSHDTPLRVWNKGRDKGFSWLICADLTHHFSMK